MPCAHLLIDVQRESLSSEKLSRAVRAKMVLEHIGYEVAIYDGSLVNPERAHNMETQLNVSDSFRAEFADRFEEAAKERLHAGDVILVTEDWHERCFKGLLVVDGGKYRGVPVVELWIEHMNPFARYRVFSTRAAMYLAAGMTYQPEMKQDWLHSVPYYKAEVTKDLSLFAISANEPSRPASLRHLEASVGGIPVVAPDWGAAAETVLHGVTGFLYRTPAGYEKAVQRAQELPSAPIVEWMNETFSLEQAAPGLAGLLDRIQQHG